MFKDLHDRAAPPPHPGDILREDLLPRLGITRAALARHLGIALPRLSDLLDERRPVTLDLALRLGQAFNNGAHYWLGLQMQHDLWHASRSQAAGIAPLQWASRARPVPAMAAAPPAFP